MIQCVVCDGYINEHATISAVCLNDLVHCFNQPQIKRVICDNCGLIFGPLDIIRMPKEELSQVYVNLYQHHSNTYNTADYFNFFRLNPTKDKKYISYACGSSPAYIANIRQDGYNLIGYDVALAYENEYLFYKLSNCPLKKFDGLVSHNYIEHVQSPVEWFIELNRLIHIDDVMIHSTGCVGYIIEGTPFHLFFHTPKTLSMLAAKTGFILEDFKKFSLRPCNTLSFTDMTVSNYDSSQPVTSDEGVYFSFRKVEDV